MVIFKPGEALPAEIAYSVRASKMAKTTNVTGPTGWSDVTGGYAVLPAVCVHCGGSKHAAEEDLTATPLMLFVCREQHQQLPPLSIHLSILPPAWIPICKSSPASGDLSFTDQEIRQLDRAPVPGRSAGSSRARGWT